MKKISSLSLLLSLLWLCLSAGVVFAQGDKVSVRIVPKPSQTNQLSLTQEMEIEMSFEGNVPPELAAMGTMKMVSKTTFTVTQKTGSANQRGNLEAEITYDQFNAEMTMNGNPLPVGDLRDKFVGKKATVTFDKEGNLVDAKLPDDLGVPAESIKQMLKSFYSNLPAATLGVGETTTAPLNMEMPMPVPGAAPLKMDGQVKFKLLALEKDGADRLAKFDQTMEGKLTSTVDLPLPTGAVKMSIDFKMSGTGDMQLNVDKALVKTSEMQGKFEGTFTPVDESSAAKVPTFKLQGTMKITMAGN